MAEKTGASVHRLSPVKISRLAFGVRYEPQFGILNHVGEIVDTILRAEGSPFDGDVFPQTSTEVSGYTLVNPERKLALQINQQDTILHWRLDSRNLDDIVTLAGQFQDYILGPLRKHAQIAAVVRHGCLFQLDRLNTNTLSKAPISRYLASEFGSGHITTLNMQFIRRLPSWEALAKKNVEDYRNVIYGIQESEEGKVQLSVDYQEYFKPLLNSSDWGKHPFGQFVERSVSFLEGDFREIGSRRSPTHRRSRRPCHQELRQEMHMSDGVLPKSKITWRRR